MTKSKRVARPALCESSGAGARREPQCQEGQGARRLNGAPDGEVLSVEGGGRGGGMRISAAMRPGPTLLTRSRAPSASIGKSQVPQGGGLSASFPSSLACFDLERGVVRVPRPVRKGPFYRTFSKELCVRLEKKKVFPRRGVRHPRKQQGKRRGDLGMRKGGGGWRKGAERRTPSGGRLSFDLCGHRKEGPPSLGFVGGQRREAMGGSMA